MQGAFLFSITTKVITTMNAKTKTATPLGVSACQMQQHAFQMWAITVPDSFTVENVTDPIVWVNMAGKIDVGDELRIMPENQTWLAKAIVTYKEGSQVTVAILDDYQLEEITDDSIGDKSAFIVENRKKNKWCVIDRETGEVVIKMIETQAKAYQERDELISARAR